MDSRYSFGLAGFVLGGLIAGLATWRILKKHYELIAEEDIADVKEHYARKEKKEKKKFEKLDKLSEEYYKDIRNDYHDALKRLGYASEEEADADPNFDKEAWLNEALGAEVNPGWTIEHEKTTISVEDVPLHIRDADVRSNSVPYVISREEFEDETSEFDRATLSYFEEDETLADERDEPIPNKLDTLGPDALDRFGDSSDDPNVVYVRNHKLGLDFEVCRNPGAYSTVILGLDEEPPPRKRKPRRPSKDEE